MVAPGREESLIKKNKRYDDDNDDNEEEVVEEEDKDKDKDKDSSILHRPGKGGIPYK